ncbi:isopenicillin N synthase family oxygenase [Allokutzneria sp. A3M-2-11 16]|uniref:isopenicillin N synthase family dioxygenase n=1 Tax=Allokutzneria sp. A3M-2-11 16 TaxID=2962043 RepID=UPI0020B86DFB|nr:2-oxoglutarate and iron-dependent oxygenase domain-containing protein [Allokutzneria sp. A3M-2-11 16]MCP3804289.1 isopenicillin N synthase family oxygenase [Allokutzneria sp. A3M-2-11 16]
MTVPHDDVPSIDLEPWFHGDEADRRAVASEVDSALRESGFLLVTGHGVPTELRASVRTAAREFFAQPEQVKRRYAVKVGERGWLPPGVEANGLAEGTVTPPDLKETYSVGSEQKTGDPELDGFWFPDNVWPAESPSLRAHAEEYLARMRALADELLTICAVALGKEEDFFTRETRHPSFTMNINRYPPLTDVGEPEPGQFRIGPHTDFGTVTILDREMGLGGLQVHTLDGRWVDAPYDPAAFTINIGDLLARWTGDRWRSTRHRVLPPDPRAPKEELVSLIFFYELSPKTWISSLGPPVGVTAYPPVLADTYLRGKLAEISV